MRFVLVTVLFFITSIAGCGKNPLSPGGFLGLAAETASAKVGAAPIQHSPGYTRRLKDASVTRIDISTTGEEWKTIFRGTTSMEMRETGVKIGVPAISVDPDEYHGIRVWFGSSGTIQYVNPNNGSTFSEIPNAQDLKGQSPWTYSTLNGNLSFPAEVKRGQAIYVVLGFTVKIVAFQDGMIPSSARTTRFVE